MSDLSYLDGVEWVPGDDGADAAEAAGEEVLHLRRALLLSHGWEEWSGVGVGGSQQVSGSSGRAGSRVRAGVGGGEATGEWSVAATLHHSQDEMDEEEKKRREKTLPGCFPFSRMRKTEVEKIKAEGAHRGNITCVNCGVATGKLLSTCGGAVGI